AFEIVVDVEGPVGADGVFTGAGGIGLELVEGEKVQAGEHGMKILFEGGDGVEGGEEEAGPIGERDFWEIVGGGGEGGDAFEFGHGDKFAVEVEAAAVVAAS